LCGAEWKKCGCPRWHNEHLGVDDDEDDNDRDEDEDDEDVVERLGLAGV
jgi:hypothetical protein